MGTFNLDTHIMSECMNSLFLSLGALFGQTVACSDRQDSLVATSAVGTQDGNTERLRLHGSTTHTLLLHSSPLQGVHGLTATFALTDRQTDGRMDSTTGRDREGGTVRDSVRV